MKVQQQAVTGLQQEVTRVRQHQQNMLHQQGPFSRRALGQQPQHCGTVCLGWCSCWQAAVRLHSTCGMPRQISGTVQEWLRHGGGCERPETCASQLLHVAACTEPQSQRCLNHLCGAFSRMIRDAASWQVHLYPAGGRVRLDCLAGTTCGLFCCARGDGCCVATPQPLQH